MKAIKIILILLIAPAIAAAGGNIKNQSFSKAKKLLLKKVYFDHKETFYCGCPFNPDKSLIPSDKYTAKRPSRRSQRIEWEHVVPAHAFGQSFKEWRSGDPDCVTRKGKPFKGRNCARKKSELFRYMEADMYNLVPAVGEVNGNRSNYSFGMIPGELREYGNCDIEIKGKKAEPRPEIRGDIARTYFYMEWSYPGHGIISRKNRKMFEAWAKKDPIDEWEKERCRRIQKIQGNENPFVLKK